MKTLDLAQFGCPDAAKRPEVLHVIGTIYGRVMAKKNQGMHYHMPHPKAREMANLVFSIAATSVLKYAQERINDQRASHYWHEKAAGVALSFDADAEIWDALFDAKSNPNWVDGALLMRDYEHKPERLGRLFSARD